MMDPRHQYRGTLPRSNRGHGALSDHLLPEARARRLNCQWQPAQIAINAVPRRI